jgi:hypothetical protein
MAYTLKKAKREFYNTQNNTFKLTKSKKIMKIIINLSIEMKPNSRDR